MDPIFPIQFSFNSSKLNSLHVTSYTIPFHINGEWFTITQETLRELKCYTISRLLSGTHENYSIERHFIIDFVELIEIIKFMMSAAAEYNQKVLQYNQQHVIRFSNHNETKNCQKYNQHPTYTFQCNRTTSTSDLKFCSPSFYTMDIDKIVSTSTQTDRQFYHLSRFNNNFESQC